jgi:hypothetical protein
MGTMRPWGSGHWLPWVAATATTVVALAAGGLVAVRSGWWPSRSTALTPVSESVSAPTGAPTNGSVGPAADPVATPGGRTTRGLVLAPQRAPTVTVAAVGDMACDPDESAYRGGAGTSTRCRQRAVSDLVVSRDPDHLFALGDLQYSSGSLADFRTSYGRSYGRLRSVTRPVVGNHEYLTSGAAGYWDYFGTRAGPRGKGWYSFTAGAWHVVALNSNCTKVSCATGSEQLTWLRADLAAHRARCTIVMWHHPRWSSGSEHGDDPAVAPFVQAAYDAGVDVVLTGHDHDYERFAPMRPSGALDRGRGLRSFVVGTGGRNLRSVGRRSTTEAVSASSFGALFLTLRPTSYSWSFVPAAGGRFTDSGSAACH